MARATIAMESPLEQIKKLKELFDSGTISKEEYAEKKEATFGDDLINRNGEGRQQFESRRRANAKRKKAQTAAAIARALVALYTRCDDLMCVVL